MLAAQAFRFAGRLTQPAHRTRAHEPKGTLWGRLSNARPMDSPKGRGHATHAKFLSLPYPLRGFCC